MVGAWNCERNWDKRIPTGLDGWTCYGLERSQYVPFWCCVAILTFAFVAVRAAKKHMSKTKASGRQRGKKETGWFTSVLAKLQGGQVAPTANSLEAGLLDNVIAE